VRWSDVEISTV